MYMELIKVHQYFIIMFSIFKPMLYNMTHTLTQWVTCDQTTLQHHQLLRWWSLIRNVCTLLNIIFLLWKLTYFLFFFQQAGNKCCLPVFLFLCVLLEPIFLFSRASLSANVWWTGCSLSKWEELERLYELETSRL